MNQPILVKKKIEFFLLNFLLLFCINKSIAQNSLTGDGFGGRLWYVSHNYCAGSYSAFSICGDNDQLYGWGDNQWGQLGNGTLISSDTPIAVKGMTNTKYYSSGYMEIAIKTDSSAWVWGLGIPSYINSGFSNVPVQVSTNVKFAHTGISHAVFVKNDGTVWGVGHDDFGELGNGIQSSNPTTIPVQMIGINNAVRAIAVGDVLKIPATIILLADSTVKITGGGNRFQATNSLIPVPIPGLKNIVDIKGNSTAAFALDANGYVYAFGTNNYTEGPLGLPGNTDSYTAPTKITFPLGAAPIIAISCSNDGNDAMALDANHNVYGWGRNEQGQLGIGNTIDQQIPVLVATNAIDIFTGETFSYVLKSDNTLWAAGTSGYNYYFNTKRYGNIWMNLPDMLRDTFTRIDPTLPPMNLCSPKILGVIQPTNCPVSIILNNQNISICSGSQYQLPSGKYTSVPGIYSDTIKTRLGCDSIISKINLSVYTVLSGNKNISICSGSQYQLSSGKYISTSGLYYDTTKSISGCDSIITKINLSIYPVIYTNRNISICSGSQYQLPSGAFESTPGIYYDTTKSSLGCDSLIAKTNLSLYPFSSSDISDSFYLGQTYTLPSGEIVNNPGDYQSVLKDVNGCDSTIRITLLAKSTAGCVRPVKAFTPNGDGFNDVWKIFTEGCVKRTEVSVYNRWGSRVYYSKDYHNDWDGNYKQNRLPDGTYYYLVNVTFYNDQIVELTGNVTIIR